MQILLLVIGLIPQFGEGFQYLYVYLFSTMQFTTNIMCILPPMYDKSQFSLQLSQFVYEILFKILQIIVCLIIFKNKQNRSIIQAVLKISSLPFMIQVSQLLMFKDVKNYKKFVYNDFSIEWGSENYWKYNFSIGIGFFLFFVFLIPLLSILNIRKFHKIQENSRKNSFANDDNKGRISMESTKDVIGSL